MKILPLKNLRGSIKKNPYVTLFRSQSEVGNHCLVLYSLYYDYHVVRLEPFWRNCCLDLFGVVKKIIIFYNNQSR